MNRKVLKEERVSLVHTHCILNSSLTCLVKLKDSCSEWLHNVLLEVVNIYYDTTLSEVTVE